MKIFIDSSHLEEIKEAYSLGVTDGVTTNPSLIRKAVEDEKTAGNRIDLESYISKILAVAKGTPVSLEVTKTDCKGMVKEGRALFKKFNPVAKNVCIKIPVNPAFDAAGSNFDGLLAINQLSRSRIPVNCTLIFTPEQALMAAKAGADMVSPFAGRIDDFIRETNFIPFGKNDYFPSRGIESLGKTLDDNGIVSGIALVRQCVEIFRQYGIKSQVLSASIRNPRQLRESAIAGADIATVPLNVLEDAMKHPKTMEGMKKFTSDVVPGYAKLGEEQ